MKNNKSGFGTIELLVVILVIGLLGAAGWFVYGRQKDNTSTKTPVTTAPVVQYKEDTDSTKTFSFSYPDSWQIKPYAWEDCCDGPPKTEPDWNVVPKPIVLYPTADEKVTVSMSVGDYGTYYYESYADAKAKVKEDYFAKILFDGKREDGHDALFSRVDYLGPPDAKVESFTDHRYYFDMGKSLLRVEFREKYHHDWYPENDLDYSKYAAEFEHIANSVKFAK